MDIESIKHKDVKENGIGWVESYPSGSLVETIPEKNPEST